jgi:hypothetical protein
MCLMDQELRSIVHEDESIGWAFVNEGLQRNPRCSEDRGEGCMVVWAKFAHRDGFISAHTFHAFKFVP